MKKFLLIFILALELFMADADAYGTEDILDDNLKGQIENTFEIADSDYDAAELVEKLSKGKLPDEYKGVKGKIKKVFASAFRENAGFILSLGVVLLLLSLIENLDFFRENNSAVRLASVSVLMLSVLKVFGNISQYAVGIIDNLILFINSLIPILIHLVSAMGKPITAGLLSPFMLGVSSVAALMVKSFVIPLTYTGLALTLTDTVTGRRYLGEFGKQIFKIIKWVTGFLLTVYIGIITVIGVSVPNVDDVTLKTAKYAVGSFIPYIGGMLTDSVELVFTCCSVVKNSVGIVGLIGIASIAFLPCIALCIRVLLLNLLSALLSPVSGKSSAEVLKNVSSCLSIMLGMVFVITVMYILSVTVIIFIGGA